MAVHKRRRDPEEERRKEEREAAKQWIYVVVAIVGAFASAPLFFLLVASVMGGWLAMLVCLLEINLIVSIGSFSLASRLFRQEPPEPGDILRIVGASSVPANVAASWIVEHVEFHDPTMEKVAGFVIGTLLAAIIASLLCMFQAGMPVWPSILVCFSYNILAVILTVIGYVLLGILFAGWLVTSGEKLPVDRTGEPPEATAPADHHSDEDLSMMPRHRGQPLAGKPHAGDEHIRRVARSKTSTAIRDASKSVARISNRENPGNRHAARTTQVCTAGSRWPLLESSAVRRHCDLSCRAA